MKALKEISASVPDSNLIVATTTGEVAGFRDVRTGQGYFFGIPYAEPPVGALRFRPTVPKKPWSGTLNATRFGAAAPQLFDPTEGSYEEFTDHAATGGENPWVGAEDCLTLNIWTPAADNRKRPVMVWIHGGANWLESSRLATYHGDNFVARGDVVFISLNYRLGIFGFLDVSVLGGDEYKGSHSHGLQDQLTALRWIKQNAAAFGGDAENITIMGESAGSIDLSWLLANGHLKGIAKRAILMSGIAGPTGIRGDLAHGFTEECGRAVAKDFLTRMQIESMNDLLHLSTNQIMERIAAVAMTADTLFYMDSLFWPRVNPAFMPADPYSAARSNGSHGIDVMIGYTSYEMGLWLTWNDTLDRHDAAWAAEKLQFLNSTQQADVAKLYDACFSDDDPGARAMHLFGDCLFVMPSVWFAGELLRHKQKVWMYQYDWESDSRRRALHAGDQTYFFGKQDTPAGRHLLGVAKDAGDRLARENLTATMQDTILVFIRHGNPNVHENSSLPPWPAYTTDKREAMSFNTPCQVISDPARTRRLWWEETVYKPFISS